MVRKTLKKIVKEPRMTSQRNTSSWTPPVFVFEHRTRWRTLLCPTVEGHISYRRAEIWWWFPPPCKSTKWACMGKPENLNSCCWKMSLLLEPLVTSEQEVVEEPSLWFSCWWALDSILSPVGWSWAEPETCSSLPVELLCDTGTSFALRNRPPDPLARFNAWRCLDSWRYGCICFEILLI